MLKTIGSVTTLALCASLGLVACGDDDTSSTDSNVTAPDGATVPAPTPQGDPSTPPAPGAPIPGAPTEAGAALPPATIDGGATPGTGAPPVATPPVPSAPAVYMAATRVFTTDGSQTTTYVQALASIDNGAKVETNKAQEFGGPAELFSLDAPRWVAIGEGESPIMTRYTAGTDLKLQKQQQLSLQNFGLQSFFSNKLYAVSPTKVYLPDPDSAQLFIIDPSNMKVLGAVALPDTKRMGYTPVYSYDYVERDGKILFTVAWFDWTNDKVLPETGLVVLDTNTDKPVRFDVDKRCAGITQPITLPSGDTYLPSSALAGALHFIKRLDLAPCALRIKAGADAFDSTYDVKLRDVTGSIAGEPIPTGGEEIFLRVLDESLVKVAADTASWGVTGQEAWRFRRWNPATNAVTNVDAIKPSTADTFWFQVDGRIFHSQTKSDYSSTQLIELNAAGGPKPALTSPGLLSGLTRIQ